MHPNAKKLTAGLSHTKHPAEEALLETMQGTHGIDVEQVKKARALGVPWEAILGLIVQFGPLFSQALQMLLAALQAKPPQEKQPEPPEWKPPVVESAPPHHSTEPGRPQSGTAGQTHSGSQVPGDTVAAGGGKPEHQKEAEAKAAQHKPIAPKK